MITDFLYNLVIFPVIQIIELIYVFTYRLFGNHGLAILGVSVAISAFTLPLYFAAEKWQKKEREIQKKLKPGMQKIKAVFRGDEQYMILAAYYRQNHYHPVYAMRSTFGILVQVPFFIAAYSFLTHLEILKSTPFFFIRDLGNPDGLLSIKGYSINILPVVMTCLNIASGVIYTKGFNLKDKLQLYGMAVVFLILLYNSPSGLVLYWTISNGFSLAKNIVVKLKKPKYFLYRASCLFVVIIDVFLLFFHGGYIVKRIFAAAVFSLIFFLPIFKTLFFKITAKISGESGRNALYRREIFVFSALNLFLLIGAVTPSLLIASSTQEFSYIEPYTSPFPFILATLNQALGLFVFWPFCLYALFSPKVKTMFSHAAGLLFVLFSVNTFLFPGDYGFISTTLVLSNPGTFFTNYLFSIINAVCLIAAVILFSRLFVSRFKKAILSFQIIVFTAFLGMTIFNFMKTEIEFNTLKQNNAYTSPSANSELFKPVFNFSQKEKNIMIIMLDRAISAYIPQIFTEKPELSNSFDGFVWYPNNVSFGKFTIFGAPPLFGGYEYTPFEIQKRNSETLLDKYNESLLVLPGIFSKNNFIVTVTDPPWANFSWKPDLTIFKSINNGGGGGGVIYSDNLSGKYTSYWLGKHPEAGVVSVSELLKNNLIRFSVFKASPVLARTFIFDRGKWLSSAAFMDDVNGDQKLTISTINEYSVLDFLSEITSFTEKTGAFIMFTNQLTHEPAFLQTPDYTPVLSPSNAEDSPYSNSAHYHANMAAFILLGKWFNYLRQNGVYDNTRIIIVSDHGWNADENFPYNIELPNGDSLETYNALLMMKDFNISGNIKTDHAFMTDADVPFLALDSVVEHPVNPFTHKSLETDKSGKVFITSSSNLHPTSHFKYSFKINREEWLSVQNDIFNIANWRKETVNNENSN